MPSKGAGAFVSGRSDAVNRRFTALGIAGALIALLAFAYMAVPATSKANGGDPPVASNVIVEVSQPGQVVVSVEATNSPDSFQVTAGPFNGDIIAANNLTGSYTYLPDPTFAGFDSFEYTATNADGTSDPATATIVVRPATTVDSGPTGLTNDNTPTFAFSSPQTGMFFECRIDADEWATCSESFTAAELTDGAHTFSVRARAGAGGPADLTPATRTFTVDTGKPTVTLQQAAGQADPTNVTPVNFALSSNEALVVGSVTSSDFTVTNGEITSITESNSDELFTIAVTPAANGEVTIAPSGDFSVSDLAGNTQEEAGGEDRSVTYDTTAPDVSFQVADGQANPTNDNEIEFTLSSDKDLNGSTVTEDDFVADNGTVDSVTGSGKSFTVTVTATAEGTVSAAPSGTFSVADSLGNATTTASGTGTDRSVTYDITAPVVTLERPVSQPLLTNDDEIEFVLTSDEALNASTVAPDDFSVSNGEITSIEASNEDKLFTIAVEAIEDGAVTIGEAAGFAVSDPAGNVQNAADGTDRTVTYDGTAPTVTLEQAAGQADPTNATPVNFALSSNEALVVGSVTSSDFTVTNGQIASITESNSDELFTIAVTPTEDGEVTIAPSGDFSVSDLAGNTQEEAGGEDRSVTYDTTAPDVSFQVADGQANPTNDDEIEFTLGSNEDLNASTVTTEDFVADNGTVDSVTGSGKSFTVTVTASAEGDVTVAPSGTFAVSDLAGNVFDGNPSGAQRTVTYDATAPTVTLEKAATQAALTDDDEIEFTLSSDENLNSSTVTTEDFDADNGTVDSVTGSGDTYTITVTASAEGLVTIAPSDDFSVSDPAGNAQTTAGGPDRTVRYNLPANVTIAVADGQADPTNQLPISFSVSSDKNLDDTTVTDSDFTAAGGTITGVTGSNKDFTVTVTASADGEIELSASEAFEVTDEFGTDSTNATGTPSVTYDATDPVITFDTKPAASSQDRDPEFTFSADETVDGVECRLDSTDPDDWEACSSPYQIEDISLGDHTFEVRATDQAGNLGSTSYDWTVTASTISATAGEPTLLTRGGDPVNLDVQASDTEAGQLSFSLQAATSASTGIGTFTTSPGGASAEYRTANGFVGEDSVTVRVRNEATGSYRDVIFTVIVKPKTVLLSGPGVGATPGLTNDNTPTITFDAVSGPDDTSVAGVGFFCRLNGELLPGSDCSGKSWTPGAALADGDYTFEVRAFVGANTDDVFEKVEFSVGTVIPDVPVITGSEGLTNDNDLAYSISLPDATTAECRLIGPGSPDPAFAACDSPVAYEGVADGQYTFEARTLDGFGNRSETDSLSATVDTVVDVTITEEPTAEFRLVGTTIEFESTEDPNVTYTCSLASDNPLYEENGGANSPLFEGVACDSGSIEIGPLRANGTHTFTVEATDQAGNKSSDTAIWTQANTAPVVPEPLNTVEAGESVTVELGSTDADGDELAYSVIRLNTTGNGGGAGSCPEGQSLVAGGCAGTVDQETGEFTFTANEDSAGTYEIEFEVDDSREDGLTEGTATVRVEPGTVIVEEPRTPFNDTTPTWTFESPSGVETFECNLDGDGYEPCDGGAFTPDEPLADGPHALAVRAVAEEDLKDPTPAISGPIVVDTEAPDVEITESPAALSNVAAPEFEFVSISDPETATFECSVDGGEFYECESGDGVEALSDGDHTFTVRATDEATNVGEPATPYEWEIDLTDPELEITSGPDEGDWTNARRPIWDFDSSDKNLVEGSLRCRVNDGAWVEDCPKGWQPTTNLSDGLHKVQIEADDGAGNTGEYEAEFRVVTLAPVAIVDEGPDSPSGPDVEFVFEPASDLGPNGGFECRTARNGGAFGDWDECASPFGLQGLESGSWTLQVRAVDSAGNRSTGAGIGSWTWSTNATVPVTEITAVSASNGNAAFGFRSTNDPLATFECKLDGGPWDVCTSPKSYSGLAVGEHIFQVRAVNQVGTVGSPVQHVWTVEAPLAPETSITRRPPAETTSTRATFEFTSDDPIATFECRLDGGSWGACTSPKVYEGVSLGQRTFEVRAKGSNGATDSSPAIHTWSVVSEIVDPVPARLTASVSAPKSAKAGKQVTLRVRVANSGTEAAQGAKVCLTAPKKLATISGSRCRTVNVAAKGSTTVSFKVKTRKGKKGRANFRVAIDYRSDGGPKKASGGHTTVLK